MFRFTIAHQRRQIHITRWISYYCSLYDLLQSYSNICSVSQSVIYTQILLIIITWLNKQKKSNKWFVNTVKTVKYFSKQLMCMRYVLIHSLHDTKDMKVYGFLDINHRKFRFLGGLKKCTKSYLSNDTIHNLNWLCLNLWFLA